MNFSKPVKRSPQFLAGILLLSLFIFAIVIALSSSLSKLSEENLIPIEDYNYFFDKDSLLNIEDFLKHDLKKMNGIEIESFLSGQAKKSRQDRLTFGSHWAWLSPDELPVDQDILMLEVAWLDHVSIFYAFEDGSYKIFQAGDNEIFRLREIQTRKPTFPILRDLDGIKVETVYLKTSAQGVFSLPLFATSTENLRKNTNLSYFFYGAWIAVLGSIAAYNATLFFSLRDNVYLHYVFYVTTYVLLLIVSAGLAQQYFWPNSPGVTTLAAHISLALVNTATAFFVIKFLKLNRSNRISYNALVLLGTLSLFCIPFVFPFGYLALIPILICSFAIMGFTLPASIVKTLEGNILAPFMLVSTIVLFPSNAVSLVRFMGFMDTPLWGEYIVEISILADALILSIGLAYRVRLLGRERDVAFDSKELAQRQFAEQLIEVREQEKKSIGQALHDSLGHKILSIKMSVNAIDYGAYSDAKNTSIDLIDEAVDEIRDLSHLLYPTVLDHLGLEKAISNMAGKILDRSNINYSIGFSVKNIEDKTKLFLYRASQECINNVIKHSNATRFELSIDQDTDTDKIYFSARDNGKNNIGEVKFGMGLTMLQQHCMLLGGKMNLCRDNTGFNNIEIIFSSLSEG